MSPEGRIDIRITLAADMPARVAVISSRPQLAQKLMAGRMPDDAIQLAGRIFSLCGRAQGLAARLACDAAANLPSNLIEAGPVWSELAAEHAWRLLLHWPQQHGQTPDMEALLSLRRTPVATLPAQLEDLLAQRLLGEAAQDWLRRDLAGFDAWRAAGKTQVARLFAALGDGPDAGACALPLLADLGADDILSIARQALAEPAFCARPVWQGRPAETGAIARVHRHPMLAEWLQRRGRGNGARLLARLIELAQMPARFSSQSAGRPGIDLPPLEGGTEPSAEPETRIIHHDAGVAHAWRLAQDSAVAAVETSRGLLLHVVRMQAGRIAEYRIVAPTEWNFHPQGPLVAALQALPVDEDLPERARQVALALDPCVDYGLEVVDA